MMNSPREIEAWSSRVAYQRQKEEFAKEKLQRTRSSWDNLVLHGTVGPGMSILTTGLMTLAKETGNHETMLKTAHSIYCHLNENDPVRKTALDTMERAGEEMIASAQKQPQRRADLLYKTANIVEQHTPMTTNVHQEASIILSFKDPEPTPGF